MPLRYHDGHRAIQDRFDSRRLADRISERVARDHLTADDAAFIHARDMFFLATCDADGRPQCSYKGGDPGFVRVLDERTLAFPSYDGNGMFLSMGNIATHAAAGLLFIDFESQKRMRVNGEATIDWDDPLTASYPEAQFVTRVHTTEVFPNCPRYIHRYRLEERSHFVPHKGTTTPTPAWKTNDWARDVLPKPKPKPPTPSP